VQTYGEAVDHPDGRTAFLVTQVFGVSYEEAAEICGCPIGTVRSRVAALELNLSARSNPSCPSVA
jgi:RNA polymerase sigma-70 factor (ECF subfamily)